jgi:hypothetical protein
MLVKYSVIPQQYDVFVKTLSRSHAMLYTRNALHVLTIDPWFIWKPSSLRMTTYIKSFDCMCTLQTVTQITTLTTVYNSGSHLKNVVVQRSRGRLLYINNTHTKFIHDMDIVYIDIYFHLPVSPVSVQFFWVRVIVTNIIKLINLISIYSISITMNLTLICL